MQGRVVVEDVSPVVEGGRFPAKATIGERVRVAADVFREGHEKVAVEVRYRPPGDTAWRRAPLRLDTNDRYVGSFEVDHIGPWQFAVAGWTDRYASWLHGFRLKHTAGVSDLQLELDEGRQLLTARNPAGVPAVAAALKALRDPTVPLVRKVEAASDPDLLMALEEHPEALDETVSPTYGLWVDRERAGFSAWYEMFPRSYGATAERSGTFRDAAKRLPAIADMGFDVVYLPPIHPIGRTHRKGRNNTLIPGPDDPGVPWAIGSDEGGHDAIHPDLGTLEDFRDFVATAEAQGMEVALDFAIQCSPDHPWVREHPEWFRKRPDGSIAYAENPPKKYQDIYPIDFDTPDIEGLTAELLRVVRHWMAQGVRIFRVDNPHTKALPFWEWLITEIHRTDPDVLFLSEAFTRPKMMKRLAKLGFTQSYTYFAWRNTKHELTSYGEELAHTDMADYFRPNFWPNTPDILTEYLQTGGQAAFKVRLALAALMVPNYGIYSGYELFEHLPVRAGSEEYRDSEKYQYKPRDFGVEWSLAPWITQINTIRRSFLAFRELRTLHFHHIGHDELVCFSKTTAQGADPVLVIANLDPHHAHDGWTWLDLAQLGLADHRGPYQVHDLLTGDTWTWEGPDNWVRLDPHAGEPVHVLSVVAG